MDIAEPRSVAACGRDSLVTCIPVETMFASNTRGHTTLVTALILIGGLGA